MTKVELVVKMAKYLWKPTTRKQLSDTMVRQIFPREITIPEVFFDLKNNRPVFAAEYYSADFHNGGCDLDARELVQWTDQRIDLAFNWLYKEVRAKIREEILDFMIEERMVEKFGTDLLIARSEETNSTAGSRAS
jgi:hypothetical protein